MSKTMKLMADYGCFPLWESRDDDPSGNVNPNDLLLSADLRSALARWSNLYDQTLNQDYPPDSGFRTVTEEDAFEIEGHRLWKELQSELGGEYKVVYFSSRESRLVD